MTPNKYKNKMVSVNSTIIALIKTSNYYCDFGRGACCYPNAAISIQGAEGNVKRLIPDSQGELFGIQ